MAELMCFADSRHMFILNYNVKRQIQIGGGVTEMEEKKKGGWRTNK